MFFQKPLQVVEAFASWRCPGQPREILLRARADFRQELGKECDSNHAMREAGANSSTRQSDRDPPVDVIGRIGPWTACSLLPLWVLPACWRGEGLFARKISWHAAAGCEHQSGSRLHAVQGDWHPRHEMARKFVKCQSLGLWGNAEQSPLFGLFCLPSSRRSSLRHPASPQNSPAAKSMNRPVALKPLVGGERREGS